VGVVVSATQAGAVLGPPEDRVLAKLSNEYATIWLELDHGANGPRLVVHSMRDHEHVELDPMALSLLCHLDADVLSLLADIARDPGARQEFRSWKNPTERNGVT